ncbi:hypothetical protein H6A30_03890 [Bacteroides caecigallinarum]|uniref:hypothetical protein n=1 Tax=Bacteroides TaxID=816 RepID=UPI001177E18C|nr:MULTISPECIES: hypothetical protein [Bacteroides]MBM6882982.1 hypothetical protein [Bacteroides caecigallinarum]MBM6889436.1 hypothetical protein [Bacteroides caecigallinarum]
MLYIITYDINTTVKDYSSLYERIKKLGDSYQHPLESVWFLSSSYNATFICNMLKQEMTDKDHVFVGELKADSDVQGWLPKSFWDWFKSEKQ